MKNQPYRTLITQIEIGLHGYIMIGLILCGCLFYSQNVYAESGESEENSVAIDETLVTFSTLDNTITTSTDNEITTTTGEIFQENIQEMVEGQQLATTNIHLQLETFDQTLFNGTFTVTECPISETSTTTALTPYCALQQVAEARNWSITFSTYGNQKFLSSINTYDGADWNWWAFFHNLDFASEALNEYILNEGDDILFTYGIFPLRLTTPSSTPTLYTTSTISVQEFGFDMSWNSAWMDSPNSTLTINDIATPITSSTYELYISTTTPYIMSATKTGFVSSNSLLIQGITPREETTTPEQHTTPQGGSNQSQGSSNDTQNAQTTRETIINKALNFLYTQQREDGGFDNLMFSDWIAIALGKYVYNDSAFMQSKNDLKTYLQSEIASQELSSLTDYERHVLGLTALGLDGTVYKQNILDEFDGTQFGIPGTGGVNDDIFGILALHELGCCTSEIQSSANLLKQYFASSTFFGTDLTAAAVRALLTQYSSSDPDIMRAKKYLQSQQDIDAAFNSTNNKLDSTSWVMDTIGTLHELTFNNWTKQSNTPFTYLSNQQNGDGSFGTTNKVWSTAYALIALSYNWAEDPGTENTTIFSSSGSSNYEDTPEKELAIETATSTPELVETLDMATSTPTTTAEAIIPDPNILSLTPDPNPEVIQSHKQPSIKQKTSPIVLGTKLVQEENEATGTTSSPDERISVEQNQPIEDTRLTNSIPLTQKLAYPLGGAVVLFGLYVGWKLVKKMI